MYFAGLDAHLRYVTVAVLDKLGAVVLETTVPTREPERLLAVLAPFRPLEVVVETCPFWPWLYDLLVPAGIGFHLAHAKRLRAIATAPQKTDQVDARLLGRMLLSGLIPEAYPRPGDQRELLRLLRHRTTLVRYRTRLAGRIHSQLHQQRLALPREKLLRQATRAWLRETAWPRLTLEQQAILTTHLELIDRLTPLIQALERRIGTVAALGHDSRDRALPQPAPGGGAAADHPLPARRARGELCGARPGDAELRRAHAPREHPPGRQSLGARGARLGDPDSRPRRSRQSGDRGLRAAQGPARLAGRAGGRRAEVAPHRVRHAAPRRAVAQRAVAGDDVRDEVHA
jgi:transposase